MIKLLLAVIVAAVGCFLMFSGIELLGRIGSPGEDGVTYAVFGSILMISAVFTILIAVWMISVIWRR